ncbi:MAG: DinB family protein [Desulfitobacteriaceae bacterium]
MGHFIFDQLSFARQYLLKTVKEISESQADIIPKGFSNNIRWNLGHVCVVQEHNAFYFAEEPLGIPNVFLELFKNGTKPADWIIKPPTLQELVDVLSDQPNRIRERLQDRLNEVVANPFSKIPGLTLKTFDELLTFSLFHESGHLETVKMLIKLTSRLS